MSAKLMRAYCTGCGFESVFGKGRCLTCNTRIDDMGPEVRPGRRRKTQVTRKDLHKAVPPAAASGPDSQLGLVGRQG